VALSAKGGSPGAAIAVLRSCDVNARHIPLPPAPLAILGLTQILGYGTTYYSFGVMATTIGRDLGWSQASLFGAFSAALLAGGLVAPVAGRLFDRIGAARMMVAGSTGAALAFAGLALAPGFWSLAAALVMLQTAATFTQYDAAFTCLVQLLPGDARRRITQLTLVAGFASSIFWPFTTWLLQVADWRMAFWLFAGLNLLVCTPAHLWLAGMRPEHVAPRPAAPAAKRPATHAEGLLPEHDRRRAMVLVAIGFSLGSVVLSAVLTQMVPLLEAVGLGPAAVLISTLFGPSQVLIRFGTMAAGPARHPLAGALVSGAMLPAGVLVLALSGGWVAGAALFAMLFGFGSGLKSIVQGTLPLSLFGSLGYGARMGRISSARYVLSALAPVALAFLLTHGGPWLALFILAALGAAGVVSLWAVARMVDRSAPDWRALKGGAE
jgi:MFS family permease